jgi:hypothetical protein
MRVAASSRYEQLSHLFHGPQYVAGKSLFVAATTFCSRLMTKKAAGRAVLLHSLVALSLLHVASSLDFFLSCYCFLTIVSPVVTICTTSF